MPNEVKAHAEYSASASDLSQEKAYPNDYLLDPKWLHEHFSYHRNGFLVRKKRTGGSSHTGQCVTGTKHWSGYRYMRIKGRMVSIHRVIFTLIHGRQPVGDLDHRDRNRANNRIGNLREATNSENAFNSKLNRLNTSGHRGVYWDKNDRLWIATIMRDGKRKKIKFSKEKSIAVGAYRKAALQHAGEFFSGH